MTDSAACGHTAVKSLAIIAGLRGINVSAEQLLREHVIGNHEPSTPLLLRMAEETGMRATAAVLDWRHLVALGDAFPIMLIMRNGNAMIATGASVVDGVPVIMLRDPLVADEIEMPVDEARLFHAWDGSVVFLKRHYKLTDVEQPFGIRWFFPEIVRQRHLFRDIGIAVLVMSFLGMTMPIITQVILDRVVVHHSFHTLQILAAGFVLVVIFEVAFVYMRSYMTLVATNKIDAVLNIRVFNRLASLPMHYFETTSAGEILRNMGQAATVRNFLTGQIFATLLECITLAVFIPFMFYFHTPLAVMVLAVTALVCLVFMVALPMVRRRLKVAYDIESKRQSFLIETIQGMRTIKSLALDSRHRREWDSRTALSVMTQYDIGKMILGLQSVIMFLQLSISLVVIVFGSYFVLEGELSVGAFIGMNMLVQRVTGPLIAMSGLMQSFQEVGISLDQLGTIMNHPVEEGRSGVGVRTPFRGEVEFQDVRFRYPGSTNWALDGIAFKAEPGTILGVMGRSGSGKTTITRVLQKLHPIQEGIVKIDGHDIREIDLDHLRSSIGVVLQESFLFRGSVAENIAAGKPHATREDIAHAAELAGATEFIERMPKGFDTLLEEGASNLSGGQRQRLAIARALLVDPPIL
ncbi:MAG TPA: peptidase domain-containing ABC transporter, partial [Azospirillaceae bacterium]|nr:peptidase domain-containing ABC transporter [Azospirillaceae bacterium]